MIPKNKDSALNKSTVLGAVTRCRSHLPVNTVTYVVEYEQLTLISSCLVDILGHHRVGFAEPGQAS
jgi:hypothetical protein